VPKPKPKPRTIKRTLFLADPKDWDNFAPYHYLRAEPRFTECDAATFEGKQIAFVGLSSNMRKGRRRVGRLGVLPKFDGCGIGLQLLNAVSGCARQRYEATTTF
jgi:hypothetical protein